MCVAKRRLISHEEYKKRIECLVVLYVSYVEREFNDIRFETEKVVAKLRRISELDNIFLQR